MKKVLSQQEIDEMIRATRSGEAVVPDRSQSVTVWDGRLPSRMGQEQMQVLNRVHQTFARNLTHSLGAYLRIHFAAELVLGEHLSFSEFLQSIPEVTYLGCCKLMPTGDSVLAQLDLSVAYPLIDVLLGGEGKGEAPSRAMTQIEEQILESVMHVVCRELQTAWQSLSVQVQFEQRQDLGQVEQLMAGTEKMLVLSFELSVLETRGALNLAIPALVSNEMLHKLGQRSVAKPRTRFRSEQRLRTRLLKCPFLMELSLLALQVPVRDLMGLSPGAVLGLGRNSGEPATLLVAGEEMFTAKVVRKGLSRAAQVIARSRKRDTEKEGNPWPNPPLPSPR